MGIAIAGALAAKLVHPDRHIVAVTGDGSYGLIGWQQYGVKLAESMGLKGYPVSESRAPAAWDRPPCLQRSCTG